MGLREEIFEQPAALSRLIADGRPRVEAVADALSDQSFDHVLIAARGTSDHAGLYAQYLWAAKNRFLVSLATPSLFSRYDSAPRLDRALVVGISQSGQSPDICSVLQEGRNQGVPTLSITNDPTSPLAKLGDHVVELNAGPELSVAATKTYTTQLVSVAMLSAAFAGDDAMFDALEALPGHVEEALQGEPEVRAAAQAMRSMAQCVVLGRGFNYASAFEWSLKLKELANVLASPYSTADFRHGPIAVVEPGFPVLAIATTGAVQEDMIDLLETLAKDRQAELLVVSDDEKVRALGAHGLSLPTGVPEWLSPVPAIVPAQLFCLHVTEAKGLDPNQPRGLTKITKSR